MTRVDADVLVAGAGPVGLAVAVLAATSGFDVLVADPRVDQAGGEPIDKACGEGLLPLGLRRLRGLGVDPPGRPLAGIRYLRATGGPTADARFRAGPGRGVRRTVLQGALAARAAGAGVAVIRGAVVGLAQDERAVQVRLRGDGGEAVVRARWLVGADGLHSLVRRTSGLAGVAPRRARYALRRHVAVSPWTDFVEVHWAPHAEAYVTPVADDLVGVALLCRGRPGSWDAGFAAFPRLAERLGAAASAGPVGGAGPVRGAGPLRQVSRRRVAGRVLLVGDAAGYVDALTGEGISVGVAQAQALVGALRLGDPQQYERAWWAVTRRYRVLTGALVGAAGHPLVRPLIVPAARRLPPAYAALVNLLE